MGGNEGLMLAHPETAAAELSDDVLVARAIVRDEAAIRAIVQRYNQRLYRLARSVLRDDVEAEDAVQQGYVKAFAGLKGFRGDAGLGTWLSRIVINVALDTARRRRPTVELSDEVERATAANPTPALDPERSLAQREIRNLTEKAIDELPEAFRTVLVARLVEGMSIDETAELLGIKPETVKTRLHRAREQVKQTLERQLGPALTGVFPFLGRRCERVADAVIARLKTIS
jgi:RNA polymerase sigma-70 factor (ECF subfamily)